MGKCRPLGHQPRSAPSPSPREELETPPQAHGNPTHSGVEAPPAHISLSRPTAIWVPRKPPPSTFQKSDFARRSFANKSGNDNSEVAGVALVSVWFIFLARCSQGVGSRSMEKGPSSQQILHGKNEVMFWELVRPSLCSCLLGRLPSPASYRAGAGRHPGVQDPSHQGRNGCTLKVGSGARC